MNTENNHLPLADAIAADAADITASISDPVICEEIKAAIIAGRLGICYDCKTIINPAKGCAKCEDAMYSKMADAFDAQDANAEASTGTDPFSRF